MRSSFKIAHFSLAGLNANVQICFREMAGPSPGKLLSLFLIKHLLFVVKGYLIIHQIPMAGFELKSMTKRD